MILLEFFRLTRCVSWGILSLVSGEWSLKDTNMGTINMNTSTPRTAATAATSNSGRFNLMTSPFIIMASGMTPFLEIHFTKAMLRISELWAQGALKNGFTLSQIIPMYRNEQGSLNPAFIRHYTPNDFNNGEPTELSELLMVPNIEDQDGRLVLPTGIRYFTITTRGVKEQKTRENIIANNEYMSANHTPFSVAVFGNDSSISDDVMATIVGPTYFGLNESPTWRTIVSLEKQIERVTAARN